MHEARVGRPTKYRYPFHCKDYVRLSKLGHTNDMIASAWEVNPETIYEWVNVHPEFSNAVKVGKAHRRFFYTNLGLEAMQGKIQGFIPSTHIFYMKNICKWHDNKLQDNPLRSPEDRPLKDMSDEELEKL